MLEQVKEQATPPSEQVLEMFTFETSTLEVWKPQSVIASSSEENCETTLCLIYDKSFSGCGLRALSAERAVARLFLVFMMTVATPFYANHFVDLILAGKTDLPPGVWFLAITGGLLAVESAVRNISVNRAQS